jgi:pectate lyase
VSNIWVDHCTFTKSYDGNLDTKAGCSGITISWCNYVGDDGATNPNSWVWQQINYLEQSPSSYPMYNFLRTRGYSTTNIVTIMQAHDKTHLAGQNDLDPDNATISMTFHHLHLGVWDRCVPRLRAGNVHDYNLYVDDTLVLAAKRLRDSIAATMSTADQNTLNNTYSFDPPVNGTISTESGAILVEKSVYIDCLWPLRNNQTDPSDPEYTGKIMALDSIYHFDNSDGSTTDYRGDSTNATGFADFGPAQAPVISFSWNLTGNQLPYTYYPDDPAQLQAIVTSPTAGAGAGVLTWNKTNWLVTSYAPTGPVVVASPQSQTVSAGQSATFAVVASGSYPLTYQWYFGTNSLIAGATSSTLTITNVQTGNIGSYFVVVSNSVSAAASSSAMLTLPASSAFQSWQNQYFGSSTNPAAAPGADPFGKGISNTNQFLLGLNPTNPASVFRILSIVPQSNDVVITWAAGGGPTNVVQATGGDVNGGYTTNFSDISGPIAIPGIGDTTNNYLDAGGATNNPSRYYRIRLGP